MVDQTTQLVAKFNQSRNDLYWSVFDLDDGFIRWTGYDDDYWWKNISVKPETQTRIGKVSGRSYRINFETDAVAVSSAVSA